MNVKGSTIGEEAAAKLFSEHAIVKGPNGTPGPLGMRMIGGQDLHIGGKWAENLYDRQFVDIMNDLVKRHGGKVGKAEIPTPHSPSFTGKAVESTVSVHAIDLTHHLKLSAKAPQPLFQTTKGSVEFGEDGKALIRFAAEADVSTVVHEIAHVARRQLFDKDVPPEARIGISDEDIKTAEDWAGAENGHWSREAEEKFARGFERYLHDGTAPSSRLKELFAKFAKWLRAIYEKLFASINVDISDAMRKVYDNLVMRSENITEAQLAELRSKPAEFDTLQQVLSELSLPVFYVPGEHDVLEDDGKSYLQRFGKGAQGAGWQSFDKNGVHFIGLVNVVNTHEGGLGVLGAEQLDWLKNDLAPLPASTPVVVFAHIPLWAVYPQWGWGTDDAEQALGFLRQFGSVTVLNGHIHQIVKKVEGNITFHTAMSTAFPQPAPGSAPKPGPLKVHAGRLSSVLGITDVNYVEGKHSLAVVDSTLA
jgi:3',5'-cyclic AMP phosphodiesterase CpdA